jgi:hypothetical protein
MANEENSIIESVTSESNNKDFDASAFISSETAKDIESIEDNQEQTTTKEEVQAKDTPKQKEATTEQGDETKEGDRENFSWDEIKVEQKSEKDDKPTESKDEDWDTVEKEDNSFDWNEIGSELNISASNKEEFVKQVKSMIENPIKDNDTVNNLQEYLKNTDEELVIADMKASKYEDDYIEDTVGKLKDSGLLKREASQIRLQLQNYIQKERNKLRQEKSNSEKENIIKQKEARKGLQDHIKSKDEFFGGKINNVEKKNLYNYITNGGFSKEIFETHANVAEAAFLWKNKDKIFKMIKTQGVEQGKSKILDNITSPSQNSRSQNSFKTKSDNFDPKAWLR